MDKNVYRILDVNFNRARDALRMMEEYCRFVLNHGLLSGRAKELRHQLSQMMIKLDANLMLCCRDSQQDVGKELRVRSQLKRISLEDCFAAAAKRAGESMRMLAEVGQILDLELYDQFEKLRFEIYSFEKDVSLLQYGILRFQNVGLYVLINVWPGYDKEGICDLVRACIDGGADCLQLRCKGIADKEILGLAQTFTELCRKGSVVNIINDRADMAILCGADGVHLGQDDISVQEVRRLQPGPLLIGKSTHTTGQLAVAIQEIPDYVALGPVFPTATKAHEPAVGLDYIKRAMEILADVSIGHVAIGGIDLQNIEQVLSLGVKTIAVSSAVSNAKDSAKMCSNLRKIIWSCRTQQ